MVILLVLIFVIGYLVIVFEEKLGINKTASALITGILCWVVFAIHYPNSPENLNLLLNHHLADVSQILFFLLGAMTIVEVIDANHGFEMVTNLVKAKQNRKLFWLVGFITFFLSAALDNLTTAIVMTSLLRKLISDDKQRKIFVALVIIAANSGGAWSPIGDVTTTMLWIGGQVSPLGIIKSLFLPSLISCIFPMFLLGINITGNTETFTISENAKTKWGSKLILATGLGGLITVPLFKALTGLPPFAGVLLTLGLVWAISEIIHRRKDMEERRQYSASAALTKIDVPGILFFFGILMAIAALETAGLLTIAAKSLDNAVGNTDAIVVLIGLLSAVIDNVPLVAASMGMYKLSVYPMDSKLWEFMAYCAGTGGSLLIIGSAAGVAVMGMEHIDFGWYLKKISLAAVAGYFAGALFYLGQYYFQHSC